MRLKRIGNLNSSASRKRTEIRVPTFGFRAAILLGVSGLGACSQVSPLQSLSPVAVTPPIPPSGINVTFCTDKAITEKSTVKYLIILDHSGSNQSNYRFNATSGQGDPDPNSYTFTRLFGEPCLATDPTGSLRYGSLSQPGTLLGFLSSLNSTPSTTTNYYFSLIDFSTQAFPYPIDSNNNGVFTSNIPSFMKMVLADSQGQSAIMPPQSGSPSASPSGIPAPTDGGETNYVGALTTAYNTIQQDICMAQYCANPGSFATTASSVCNLPDPKPACANPGQKVSASYDIVFISDGSPIMDLKSNNAPPFTYTVTKQEPGDVLPAVDNIMTLVNNKLYVNSINLYTVYYYYNGLVSPTQTQSNLSAQCPTPYSSPNIDPSGQQLLQEMASPAHGNGVAYSAVSGDSIDFSKFAAPTKLLKNTLVDIFVTNPNVAFWTSTTPPIPGITPSQPLLDSDMDGLPDVVENYYGSDPFNPDSDGNGVSDAVELYLNGNPSKNCSGNNNCNANGGINYYSGSTNPLPACAGQASPLPAPVYPGALPMKNAIQFAKSDPDGLNDCEKILLHDGEGIDDPDSNGDFIADWLEFINGVAFQVGSLSASASLDPSGYSLANKIKFSLPVNYPYSQILNVQPTQYNLTQTSTSPVQDCYQLTVNNLPTIGPNNHVRVDVMMKDPSGNLVYRVGMKQFQKSSLVLDWNDWNDPAEKAAGTWSSWP